MFAGVAAPAVAGAGTGATGTPPAFKPGALEEIHQNVILRLVGTSRTDDATDPQVTAALAAMRANKDALSRPLVFRGREDTLDLSAFARHIQQHHQRLMSETMVQVVDQVSKTLRLHQHDCCVLVEKAMGLTTSSNLMEVLTMSNQLYYRECCYQARCFRDMAENLLRDEIPDKFAVSFFAMVGGRRFLKALFEALVVLLRDLTGERSGDAAFQAHCSEMIQMYVETAFLFSYAFKADVEDAEMIISLLPHVVNPQFAPMGQGFTISDLDLILREEHAEISMKLCLALVCMFTSNDARIDLSSVPEDVDPEKVQDFYNIGAAAAALSTVAGDDPFGLPARADGAGFGLGLGGSGGASGAVTAMASSPLGTKMKTEGYWNEDSQLGQFLSFSVGGVLLEDQRALKHGYVHWHVINFVLHEVLLSAPFLNESSTSRLAFICISDLLARALLPIGRNWVQIKKLETQALAMNYLHTPFGLQISLLQALNRLCRVHPPSCEIFREIAVHCTDTFHLSFGNASRGGGLLGGGGGDGGVGGLLDAAGGAWSRLRGVAPRMMAQPDDRTAWIGAPPSTAVGASMPMPTQAQHDGTALYAEILDFTATLIGRGPMKFATLMCQKLMSHSNQWFNWGFLVDTLAQVARTAAAHPAFGNSFTSGSLPVLGGGIPPAPQEEHHRGANFPAALCHLVTAFCSSRLWVTHPPPPHPGAAQGGTGAAMSAVGPASGAQAAQMFAPMMLELLASHPEMAVKASCLSALSHFDVSAEQAKGVLAQLNGLLPALLSGVTDVRGSADGLLAIELLSCYLRLVQAVPLNRGRYAFDLQPLTFVVVHHIFLKVLADPTQFASSARFWRLANLAFRWLRVVLRGPLPLSTSQEVNKTLIEPYADGNDQAAEVAMRTNAGNATAYVFRCLLTLDSPLFSRAMYLILLRGQGVQFLAQYRDGGAARIWMEQTTCVGLDVLRILFQRDVLFIRHYGQQAPERAADGAAGVLDASGGGLLHAHQPLFSEFPFQYPVVADNATATPAASDGNPFAARRLWQGGDSGAGGAGVGGAVGSTAGDVTMGVVPFAERRRAKPSYLALLLEFAGCRIDALTRLVVYLFTQCALREPTTTLRTVQLEPGRLQCLARAFHDAVLQCEEETAAEDADEIKPEWDAEAEAAFMDQAMEMDLPATPDVASHSDVISLRTGQPFCKAVDAWYQLKDDAWVQSVDLAVWARSNTVGNLCSAGGGRGALGNGASLSMVHGTGGAASSEASRFRIGYLRGLDTHASWLCGRPETNGGGAFLLDTAFSPPHSVLASTTCRMLILRSLALLLGDGGGSGADSTATSATSKLAHALLGLDPEGFGAGLGAVAVDRRLAQPSLLGAIISILDAPPPMPPVPVDIGGLSGGSALAPRHVGGLELEPYTAHAVQEHVAYEAALGIVVAMLTAPSLREFTFRQVFRFWPSRYKTLREHLSLHWAKAPLPLRRVLLSEATLLLRIAAWEMRFVPPFGLVPLPPLLPPAPAHGVQAKVFGGAAVTEAATNIESQQRLDMRRVVAEQIKELVDGFVGANQFVTAGQELPTSLVALAQRLADACELTPFDYREDESLEQEADESAAQSMSTALRCPGPLRDLLRNSGCPCLAPSEAGPLAMQLDMLDPHLFVCLCGGRASGLGTFGDASGADAAAGGSVGIHDVVAGLEELAATNEARCISFFAKHSFQALEMFISGIFFHVTGSIRRYDTTVARSDSAAARAAANSIRAHLEVLMPCLASAALSRYSPPRLELFTEFFTVLITAMVEVDIPMPLSFAFSLFCVLRDSILYPLGTPASRGSAQRAMMLLVQRMLPNTRNEPRDLAEIVVADDDLEQLRQLARGLLASAASTGGRVGSDMPTEGLAESYRFGGIASLLASASVGTGVGGIHGGCMSEIGIESTLTLLAALLLRVPKHQLSKAFEGDAEVMWLQLMKLFGAKAAGQQSVNLAGGPPTAWLRPSAAIVASLLCRCPELAARFFERGGLTALLETEFLNVAQAPIRLPGLQPLDGPHPAPLLAILHLLVTLVSSLPAHRLALASVLLWFEKNLKPILDVLHWVNRLPLNTSVEPRHHSVAGGASTAGLGPRQQGHGLSGAAVRAASAVANVVASSGGTLHRSALMLLCVGSDSAPVDADCTLDLVSTLAVVGDRWWSASASVNIDDAIDKRSQAQSDMRERDRLVALSHHCAMLTVELWDLLSAAALQCSDPRVPRVSDALFAAMDRIAPQIEPAVQATLTQVATLAPPLPPQPEGNQNDDIGQTSANLGSRAVPTFGTLGATAPFGALNATPTFGTSASSGARVTATTSPQVDPSLGLYPSEPCRLAMCLRVLQAWRHDPIAQEVQTIVDCLNGGKIVNVNAEAQGAAWAAAPWNDGGRAALTAATPQLSGQRLAAAVGQTRSRALALCTVVVHMCDDLMRINFVGPSQAAARGDVVSMIDSPHLQFEGTQTRFKQLLLIVEIALHLLCINLGALTLIIDTAGALATAAPSPTTGAPRLAVLTQYLRVLQQLSSAVGGTLAPVERAASRPPRNTAETGLVTSASAGGLLAAEPVDVSFAARLAERVELLLSEQQSI